MDMTGESSEHRFLSPSLPSCRASVSRAERRSDTAEARLGCRLTGFLSNRQAAFICQVRRSLLFMKECGDVIGGTNESPGWMRPLKRVCWEQEEEQEEMEEQGGSLRDNCSVVPSLFGEEFGKKPNDAVAG